MDANQLDLSRLTAETFLDCVEHFAVLPSTQDRAREEAANPLHNGPLLVVADRQSAGRGREGNIWWTGAGSLAFSLLFDPAEFGCPRRPIPCLSLAASVAIIDAVAPRVAGRQVGLHWPNDVFVDERKLAGVLVEVLPDGRHILGVGLNTNNRLADAPAELQATATTLFDLTGQAQDHTELLIGFMGALATRMRQLGSGSETLAACFDDLCLQRGRTLTLFLGDRSISGLCMGIAGDGGLVLETAEGRRTFHSGTLHPPQRGRTANSG